MASNSVSVIDKSENKVVDKIVDKKPKKVKPYSENEALKRGQKKYFEKNREAILKMRREIYKRWRERQDIEVLRAKQRERSAKYYQNKRMLKELEKQQEENSEVASSINENEVTSSQSTNIETSESESTSEETEILNNNSVNNNNNSVNNNSVNNNSTNNSNNNLNNIIENTKQIVIRAYTKLREYDKSSSEFARGLLSISRFLKKIEQDFGEQILIYIILGTMSVLGVDIFLEQSIVDKLLKCGAVYKHINAVESYDSLILIS